jgi:hypothetical protein
MYYYFQKESSKMADNTDQMLNSQLGDYDGSNNDSMAIDIDQKISLNQEYIREQRSLGQLDAMTRHRDVTPDDLLPQSGNGALQVVYYSSVHFTDMNDEGTDLREFDGPIELSSIDEAGFTKPAVGVRIRTEQSWRAAGVTLGHLLHSISLAPGEITKVAIMDWSRREAGKRAEMTDQADKLAATNDQKSAHGDVTNSVANELQTGASKVETSGTSSQGGSAGGGIFAGLFGGSTSRGGSNNTGISTSVGFSTGTKNVAMDETEKIQSLTHQSASAIRSRRAATVEETTQGEKQTATTRVLANYNHMHTLNIMYYEVVQNFKVVTKVTNCERVLFIPFKPFVFTKELILAHHSLLQRAADARGAGRWSLELFKLTSPDSVLSPPSQDLIDYLNINTLFYSSVIWINSDSLTLSRALSRFSYEGRPVATSINLNPIAITGNYLGFLWPFPPANNTPVSKQVFTINNNSRQWPAQGKITKITFSSFSGFAGLGSTGVNSDFPEGNIIVVITNSEGYIVRQSTSESINIPDVFKVDFEFRYFRPSHLLTTDKSSSVSFSLFLEDGREIRGTCVFAFEQDPQRVTIFNGRSACLTVKTVFGPSPSEEQQAWEQQFLNDQSVETVIPMATGGIFAEAVLGRANAAEKLDLTRFWDWLDSPIPVLPPDINAVDMSSRYQQVNNSTHELEANAAALQQLTQVPALQGMLAASEIMKANIFRDMSGAKEAAENASKALGEASKGADGAAKTAMDGQKAAMDNVTKLISKAMDTAQTAAAPEATAAMGVGGNISEKGAAANLDEVKSAGKEAAAGESSEKNQVVPDLTNPTTGLGSPSAESGIG